jgi:hypothetical protein
MCRNYDYLSFGLLVHGRHQMRGTPVFANRDGDAVPGHGIQVSLVRLANQPGR